MHHILMVQGARLHSGGLERGMHSSLPPKVLLFHSPSVAKEKAFPIHCLNTASNLWTTNANINKGISQQWHLNVRSRGMCAYIPCATPCGLHATDTYNSYISNCCYLVCDFDNCYKFKTFALLMYSRGVSLRVPSKPMMSQLFIALFCVLIFRYMWKRK